MSRFGQERGDIEGKAGRRRRREDDKVEAGEERTGLRRVKRRRSRMFGGILTPSLSLPFCFKRGGEDIGDIQLLQGNSNWSKISK